MMTSHLSRGVLLWHVTHALYFTYASFLQMSERRPQRPDMVTTVPSVKNPCLLINQCVISNNKLSGVVLKMPQKLETRQTRNRFFMGAVDRVDFAEASGVNAEDWL